MLQVEELRHSTEQKIDMKSPLLDIELQGFESANDLKFYKCICGVVPVTQQITFSRMIYRTSRGNAFIRFLDIDEVCTPSH